MPTVFASILVLFGFCLAAVAGFMMHDADARKIVLIIAGCFILIAVVVEISSEMWK